MREPLGPTQTAPSDLSLQSVTAKRQVTTECSAPGQPATIAEHDDPEFGYRFIADEWLLKSSGCRRPSAVAQTAGERSVGPVHCIQRHGASTSPTGSPPGSTPAWPPATRNSRSPSPGAATNAYGLLNAAGPSRGPSIAAHVIDSLHTCPIPEVARLGPTLKAWRQHVLAYLDTDGVSNGGTEAINLIIEKVRCLVHGFRDLGH